VNAANGGVISTLGEMIEKFHLPKSEEEGIVDSFNKVFDNAFGDAEIATELATNPKVEDSKRDFPDLIHAQKLINSQRLLDKKHNKKGNQGK